MTTQTPTIAASKRIGQYTVQFQNVFVSGRGTAVGPREGAGPLGHYFDHIEDDSLAGERTPEKAERQYLQTAARIAMERANVRSDDIQYFFSGDLLNQIITSNFVAHELNIPFFGLFSACATFAQGLGLGSMLLEGDFAQYVLVASSSHYQSVERQYRYPIELNVQRKATNQSTTTGAGAVVLQRDGTGPRITLHTTGRVTDYGMQDVNDMGSAMAPAAADTLLRHLHDTNQTVGDYDLILTGDLGSFGSHMFRLLMKDAGITLGNKHNDCGVLLYSPMQQPGAGASGAACAPVVTLGYALQEMENGRYNRILCLPTGSLHSPLSYQQGENIPTISHAIAIEW